MSSTSANNSNFGSLCNAHTNGQNPGSSIAKVNLMMQRFHSQHNTIGSESNSQQRTPYQQQCIISRNLNSQSPLRQMISLKEARFERKLSINRQQNTESSNNNLSQRSQFFPNQSQSNSALRGIQDFKQLRDRAKLKKLHQRMVSTPTLFMNNTLLLDDKVQSMQLSKVVSAKQQDFTSAERSQDSQHLHISQLTQLTSNRIFALVKQRFQKKTSPMIRSVAENDVIQVKPSNSFYKDQVSQDKIHQAISKNGSHLELKSNEKNLGVNSNIKNQLDQRTTANKDQLNSNRSQEPQKDLFFPVHQKTNLEIQDIQSNQTQRLRAKWSQQRSIESSIVGTDFKQQIQDQLLSSPVFYQKVLKNEEQQSRNDSKFYQNSQRCMKGSEIKIIITPVKLKEELSLQALHNLSQKSKILDTSIIKEQPKGQKVKTIFKFEPKMKIDTESTKFASTSVQATAKQNTSTQKKQIIDQTPSCQTFEYQLTIQLNDIVEEINCINNGNKLFQIDEKCRTTRNKPQQERHVNRSQLQNLTTPTLNQTQQLKRGTVLLSNSTQSSPKQRLLSNLASKRPESTLSVTTPGHDHNKLQSKTYQNLSLERVIDSRNKVLNSEISNSKNNTKKPVQNYLKNAIINSNPILQNEKRRSRSSRKKEQIQPLTVFNAQSCSHNGSLVRKKVQSKIHFSNNSSPLQQNIKNFKDITNRNINLSESGLCSYPLLLQLPGSNRKIELINDKSGAVQSQTGNKNPSKKDQKKIFKRIKENLESKQDMLTTLRIPQQQNHQQLLASQAQVQSSNLATQKQSKAEKQEKKSKKKQQVGDSMKHLSQTNKPQSLHQAFTSSSNTHGFNSSNTNRQRWTQKIAEKIKSEVYQKKNITNLQQQSSQNLFLTTTFDNENLQRTNANNMNESGVNIPHSPFKHPNFMKNYRDTKRAGLYSALGPTPQLQLNLHNGMNDDKTTYSPDTTQYFYENNNNNNQGMLMSQTESCLALSQNDDHTFKVSEDSMVSNNINGNMKPKKSKETGGIFRESKRRLANQRSAQEIENILFHDEVKL